MNEISVTHMNVERLREQLMELFSLDELRVLTYSLGVDYDSLPEGGKSTKIRELILYLARHGQLENLIQEASRIRPSADWNKVISLHSDQLQPAEQTGLETRQKDVIGLESDIASLRQVVLELQSNVITDEKLKKYSEELLRYANRAIDRTEDLKAELELPPPEKRKIRMIPEHQVSRLEDFGSRLEQHRSDENIAFLLIGLFAGAAVGIVVNWATNDTFNPTPVSITFLIFFLVLTLGAGLWTYRIHKRVSEVQNQIARWPSEAMDL